MLVFCWLVRVLSCKEYVCCVRDVSVCVSMSSIHMSDLCVCMRDVISEFSSEIVSRFYFVSYVFWK